MDYTTIIDTTTSSQSSAVFYSLMGAASGLILSSIGAAYASSKPNIFHSQCSSFNKSRVLRRPLTLLFWLVKLQKRLLDARAQAESDAAESARKSAEADAAASKADKLHLKQDNLLPKLAKPQLLLYQAANRLNEAEAYLTEVRCKPGQCFGQLWWIDRELYDIYQPSRRYCQKTK